MSREFNSINKTFVKDGFFLPLAKGGASWIDADMVFVSTDFGEGSMTDSGYPRIVKRWKRGTPLEAAELVYEGDVKSVSASASRLHSTGDDVDLVRDGKTFWTSERFQLVDGELKKLELPLSATVNGAFQGRLIISLKEDWTRGQWPCCTVDLPPLDQKVSNEFITSKVRKPLSRNCTFASPLTQSSPKSHSAPKMIGHFAQT